MKKGFTLIELLSVIVILGIVTGLAVISVTYLVNGAQNKVYKDYEKTLESGARNYFLDDMIGSNHDPSKVSLPSVGGTVTLTYTNLRNNDSSFNSLKDPKAGGNCDSSYVRVTRGADKGVNYNLTYKVCLICPNSGYKSSGC